MKVNKIHIIIAILILVMAGIIMYISSFSEKTITSFFDNDIKKIDKIEIMDGNNGKIINVDDKKVTRDICEYLSKLKLRKFLEPPCGGWSYRFTIYENKKEKIDITFRGDTDCEINGTKYKIEKSTSLAINSLFEEARKSIKQ